MRTELVGVLPLRGVQAAACRIVAELLCGGQLEATGVASGTTESEYADRLVDCELGLIADGEDALRITLRIAVLETAWHALRTCAEIRALPEPPLRLIGWRGADDQEHRT